MHAAAFSTPHGAGVACLTYTGNLLVYSLPGLEPLLVRDFCAPLVTFLSDLVCSPDRSAALSVDPGADSCQ